MPPLRSRRSVLTLNAGPPPPGGHPECPSTLLKTLRNLNPQYPQVDAAAKAELAEAKKELVGNDGDAAAESS